MTKIFDFYTFFGTPFVQNAQKTEETTHKEEAVIAYVSIMAPVFGVLGRILVN